MSEENQGLVVFSHGKESGPQGTKIRVLSGIAEKHGWATDSIDYTDMMDPDERVGRLLDELEGESRRPLVLVGSSMGAYVALVAAAALRPQGVFLMAPALYIPGWKEQQYPEDLERVSIVHGWHDELIPPDNVLRYAKTANCDLHLLPADHRLSAVLPELTGLFEAFLRRVRGGS
ncbi:MAG: alpha/beta fold hydrolase [Pseudohongiellaceae bacterium]